MVVFLGNPINERYTLEATTVEAFTKKSFSDLITEAHAKKQDYFLSKVTTSAGEINCYDARQLCRYVFEMVISPNSRFIRIKNFKDPINHDKIIDVSFFKLKHDTDEKLMSECMGNHKDFLERNCFRRKIFRDEDPMYALSVNFEIEETKKVPFINKRHVITSFIMIIIVLMLSTTLVLLLERNGSFHPYNKVDEFLKLKNGMNKLTANRHH